VHFKNPKKFPLKRNSISLPCKQCNFIFRIGRSGGGGYGGGERRGGGGGGGGGGAGAFGCWPFTPRVLGSQTYTPVNLIFLLLFYSADDLPPDLKKPLIVAFFQMLQRKILFFFANTFFFLSEVHIDLGLLLISNCNFKFILYEISLTVLRCFKIVLVNSRNIFWKIREK
jgi:hypothetical protein